MIAYACIIFYFHFVAECTGRHHRSELPCHICDWIDGCWAWCDDFSNKHTWNGKDRMKESKNGVKKRMEWEFNRFHFQRAIRIFPCFWKSQSGNLLLLCEWVKWLMMPPNFVLFCSPPTTVCCFSSMSKIKLEVIHFFSC